LTTVLEREVVDEDETTVEVDFAADKFQEPSAAQVDHARLVFLNGFFPVLQL
jgi:hypothetical protein